jgi:hypothetical protein
MRRRAALPKSRTGSFSGLAQVPDDGRRAFAFASLMNDNTHPPDRLAINGGLRIGYLRPCADREFALAILQTI